MDSGGPENPARGLEALAAQLEARGDAEAVAAVREAAASLVVWQQGVRREAAEALSVHHDINNALTGVLGNAQLLLMGPAAEVNGARKRLESLSREAERIRVLTARLREVRSRLLAAPGANGEGTR